MVNDHQDQIFIMNRIDIIDEKIIYDVHINIVWIITILFYVDKKLYKSYYLSNIILFYFRILNILVLGLFIDYFNFFYLSFYTIGFFFAST